MMWTARIAVALAALLAAPAIAAEDDREPNVYILDGPVPQPPGIKTAMIRFRCEDRDLSLWWRGDGSQSLLRARAGDGRPEIDLVGALQPHRLRGMPFFGAEAACRWLTDQGALFLHLQADIAADELPPNLPKSVQRYPTLTAPGGAATATFELYSNKADFARWESMRDRRVTGRYYVWPVEPAPALVTASFGFDCVAGGSSAREIEFSWTQVAGQAPDFTLALASGAVDPAAAPFLRSLFSIRDRIIGADVSCFRKGERYYRLDIHYRHHEMRRELGRGWLEPGSPVDPEVEEVAYFAHRVYSVMIHQGRIVQALAAPRDRR